MKSYRKLLLLFILAVILFLFIYIYRSYYLRENFEHEKQNIIGYIHVCQKKNWQRSFDLLMNDIKSYGLYENTTEIRVGVVNDEGILIEDDRLKDPKIKIVYVGKSEQYERPTLLHMKESCTKDPDNTLYYYLHTKGISHFDTEFEKVVVDWIRSMLYYNIQLWEDAASQLRVSETYGCHHNINHYSGNFWWSTANHIKKLPDIIPHYYTAPEDWVLYNSDNMFCAYNCGKDFKNPYPDKLYKK
jgi:hypothetical protein